MVRFPASLANLASWKDCDDVRTYDLESQAAQQLATGAQITGKWCAMNGEADSQGRWILWRLPLTRSLSERYSFPVG